MTTAGGAAGLEDAYSEPGRLLMHTTSVADAERRGARLLSPHRVIPDTASRFDARVHGLSLGSVALYHLVYGTELTVTGPPPDDFVAITLPLRGALRVGESTSAFEVSAARSAAVIPSDARMTLRWSPDLALLCLRIDFAALASFARSIDPRSDVAKVRFSPLVRSETVVNGLLGWARLVQLAADPCGGDGNWPPPLAARFRDQIMTTLLVGQPNSCRDALLSARPDTITHAAVRRAAELAEAEPTRYSTPAQLAAAVGVSIRALQRGFRDALDTTPHEHLTTLRLRRAREELLSAHPADGTTVTDIARRCGFTHVGRFATVYYRTYGEKPSATLRRA